MAWAQPQYATTDQLKAYAGIKSNPASTDADLTVFLKAASSMIDRRTGTWWTPRSITLTGQGVADSPLLWLPARAISITSLTESGVARTRITSPTGSGDYWLVAPNDRLEKNPALLWPQDRRRFRGWWSTVPNDIVIVGSFGNVEPDGTTVMLDIVELTCGIAAAIAELRRREYIDEQGEIASLPVSTFPGWIGKALATLKWRQIHSQAPWAVA